MISFSRNRPRGDSIVISLLVPRVYEETDTAGRKGNRSIRLAARSDYPIITDTEIYTCCSNLYVRAETGDARALGTAQPRIAVYLRDCTFTVLFRNDVPRILAAR